MFRFSLHTMEVWREVLSTWAPRPAPILLAALALGVYGMAVRRIRRTRPSGWPARRTVAHAAGVLSGLFVVVGPPGALDDTLFSAHMVQHLVLTMVTAPLLVLGAPVLLLLEVSSARVRRTWIVPVLRSRLATWLTIPWVGWVLFAGTIVATHFSPFYDYAIRHPFVHDYVEHPLYLGVALVFYYPLVGSNPVPHGPSPLARVLSLFLMAGPMSMTGFFIYTARAVLYPSYLTVDGPLGSDALGDQQLAGGIMWCLGMVVQVGWVALAVPVWLRAEERKARRLDQTLVPTGPAGAQ